MLSPIASVSLGIVFTAIAGTNVWLMLRASSASQTPDRRATFLRLHRLGGYLFLSLFAVMFLCMNLRVLGVKHGLPLAATLHSTLAFLLVLLLLVKVVIARHYKQQKKGRASTVRPSPQEQERGTAIVKKNLDRLLFIPGTQAETLSASTNMKKLGDGLPKVLGAPQC